MSSRLTPEQTRLVGEAARRLAAAEPCSGARGLIVRDLAGALGVSMNTAYVYLRKLGGFESGKKTRADKGRTGVGHKVCREISGLMLEARRKTGKQIMSLKQAVEILRGNGEEIMHSPETISRAMRLYGCHPGQLKTGRPTGRARSLYPNHIWQLDASVCVIYYLKGGKGVRMLDESSFNEKKPANLEKIKNLRVVRYVVTDHCSGAFYHHYEQAAGENAEGVLRTLIGFIADRGNCDPAHGVPEILYTDNGSGNISSLVKGFCEQLEIRFIQHAPKNANATGSVEKGQDIVERGFESRLRFTDIPDIETLNREADRWRRHFLATAIHSRTKKTRNAAWLNIPEDKLKTVPRDVLEAIAHWRDERRPVGHDFTITVNTRTSFGALQYDLRELAYHGLNVKDCVRVRLNPFRAPEAVIVMDMPDGSEKRFNVKPIEKDNFGQDISAPVFGEEFRAMPKTHTEKMLDQIRMEAWGAASAEEADLMARHGKKPFARLDIMADVKEAPTYLGRMGKAANITVQTAEPAPMTRVAFAMMMKREHAEIWNDRTAADCMEWLAVRYPDVVPGTEIENVIAKMADKFAPRPATVLPFMSLGGGRACAQ